MYHSPAHSFCAMPIRPEDERLASLGARESVTRRMLLSASACLSSVFERPYVQASCPSGKPRRSSKRVRDWSWTFNRGMDTFQKEKCVRNAHHSPDGFSRYPPRTRACARKTKAGRAPVDAARAAETHLRGRTDNRGLKLCNRLRELCLKIHGQRNRIYICMSLSYAL